MQRIDPTFWLNRRVLVTGHTGFKGTYLCAWLAALGADIVGFAHPPRHAASLHALAGLDRRVDSVHGDVRERELLVSLVEREAPEVIFHLAAQPLVLTALKEPADTLDTNIQGTINILEAARRSTSVRSLVVVTSDKCYRPQERPLVETDPLGGLEPYAASKACAEIVVEAYRACYLAPEDGIGVATARAGNVIGAGDFNANRLVSDLVRGIAAGRRVTVRNPASVRPWQHVLDALHGYLLLAQALADDPDRFARGWNFGPVGEREWTVAEIADEVVRLAGGAWEAGPRSGGVETPALRLASEAAVRELGWRPRLGIAEALAWTVDGYKRLLGHASGDWLFEQIETFSRRHGRALADSAMPDRSPPLRLEEGRPDASSAP